MKPKEILELEEHLGFELTEVEDVKNIFEYFKKKPTFLLNNKQEVEGLNLRTSGLKDVHFLKGMKCLTSLNLRNNQINNISFLGEMKNLTVLYLDNNRINDISSLQRLTNLTTLYLGNNQINDISFLQGLTNLTTLYLGNNQINDISFLQGLINLTALDFDNNQINDISYLQGLTNLIALDSDNNQINDISYLHGLTNLTTLSLSNNQINDISFLQEMKNLTTLNLGNNKINDISFLQEMKNLSVLYLSHNQINDISFLQGLTNLTALYLDHNQIYNIDALEKLIKLMFLRVKNNIILKLPAFFKKFDNIHSVHFTGNPFMKYVPMLGGLKAKDKISYILDLQERSRPVREAKVVFVGQGDIGKTTLIGWILDGKKNDTGQTLKIDVRDNDTHFTYCKEKSKTEPLTVHFWDFGGQEIMHATHKFFMTERTVYVLVTNNRSEDDERLDQWIELLKSTCGNSPVIIVANKCDDPALKHSLSDRDLKYKFDNIRLPVIATSGHTGRGKNELKDAIQEALQELDFLEFPVPEPFFNAKEKLQALGRDYIEYDKFEDICTQVAQEENYDFGEGKQEVFADLLNDLGVLLNFRRKGKDAEKIEDLMIFSPEWIINGVFAIVLGSQTTKGIIEDEQVQKILKSKGIKKAKEREYIIKMMQSFKLSYENAILDKRRHFIPSVFDKNRPFDDLEKCWGTPKKPLRFRFHYQVWRNDYINYIIVKEHEHIKGNPYWRNGVVLEYDYDDLTNRIKVEALQKDKCIDLEITGTADMRYTLERFRKVVMPYIHAMFTNIEPSEWIVYEEEGITVELDYEELALSLQDGRTDKYVKEFRKAIDIKSLLGYIDLPKEDFIDFNLASDIAKFVSELGLEFRQGSYKMQTEILSKITGSDIGWQNELDVYLNSQEIQLPDKIQDRKENDVGEFKTALLSLLEEKQQNAVADILVKIKESNFDYNKTLYQDLENNMMVASQSLLAPSIVNTAKILISTIKGK